MSLRREFASREELIAYLRERFPECGDTPVSAIRGGRKAALAALEEIHPDRYARTRNFLDGAVSRLSPYIRHGVLSLREVRDHALRAARTTSEAYKFVFELAWREYWQRLYSELGSGIWADREAYKTGWLPGDYADALPADIPGGQTQLACMDSFAAELRNTGYLHNHARMWVAAYVVHFRRVKWQAGARWFLDHLLDGDPASNNLSWQWVASTFASKPYIFNRENLEKYTKGKFCEGCPSKQACPFDVAYEELDRRLFR